MNYYSDYSFYGALTNFSNLSFLYFLRPSFMDLLSFLDLTINVLVEYLKLSSENSYLISIVREKVFLIIKSFAFSVV